MVDAVKRCGACGARPRANGHANTKYCEACRAERRRRPRSNVTPAQAMALRQLVGQIPQVEIRRRLGLSKAAITRCIREQGWPHKHFNQPDDATIDAVCRVFEQGGRHAVQAQFPDIKWRSIIERYKRYLPRQIRWTAEQMIEAARMAGLVSPNAQARYFGRPNAYAGAIKSLWVKRLHCAPRDINGLAAHTVWPLVRPGVPAVLVPYQGTNAPKAKVLWLDLVTWLKPDVDPVVREIVEVLAQFQAWLWQTSDTEVIRSTIAERESRYGDDPSDDERPASAAERPIAHADAATDV